MVNKYYIIYRTDEPERRARRAMVLSVEQGKVDLFYYRGPVFSEKVIERFATDYTIEGELEEIGV